MRTNREPRTTNIQLGISSYAYSWAVGVPGHKPAHPLDENGLLDKARELGVQTMDEDEWLALISG